jgi:hypothetical protein
MIMDVHQVEVIALLWVKYKGEIVTQTDLKKEVGTALLLVQFKQEIIILQGAQVQMNPLARPLVLLYAME